MARLVLPLGAPKLGVLVRLKTWARKSKLLRSAMRKFLISDIFS